MKSKSNNIVSTYVRQHYSETECDEIRYIGRIMTQSTVKLYYEKQLVMAKCNYCNWYDQCRQYGDMCDEDKYQVKDPDIIYEVDFETGALFEVDDRNKKIRDLLRNSYQEVKDTQGSIQIKRRRLECSYENKRQFEDTKIIFVHSDEFINKDTQKFSLDVIKALALFKQRKIVYIWLPDVSYFKNWEKNETKWREKIYYTCRYINRILNMYKKYLNDIQFILIEDEKVKKMLEEWMTKKLCFDYTNLFNEDGYEFLLSKKDLTSLYEDLKSYREEDMLVLWDCIDDVMIASTINNTLQIDIPIRKLADCKMIFDNIVIQKKEHAS